MLVKQMRSVEKGKIVNGAAGITGGLFGRTLLLGKQEQLLTLSDEYQISLNDQWSIE